MRHYSRKTLKAYADWSRKFQGFLRDKTPDALTADDVKAYLTYLAVNCKVAASTQNQAFNALLFLYRHILKKDFGEHKDIPRAKRSNYIPIVLSRKEIDSVLKYLPHPYNLIVKFLYGWGLRLFEGVKLRVKDFNFDPEFSRSEEKAIRAGQCLYLRFILHRKYLFQLIDAYFFYSCGWPSSAFRMPLILKLSK